MFRNFTEEEIPEKFIVKAMNTCMPQYEKKFNALNDVEDGGETYFTSQDIKIPPKAGSFIVWPAYWTHPHHGLVSNTQTKYIATGWFTFLPKQQLSAIKSRVAALKLIA